MMHSVHNGAGRCCLQSADGSEDEHLEVKKLDEVEMPVLKLNIRYQYWARKVVPFREYPIGAFLTAEKFYESVYYEIT